MRQNETILAELEHELHTTCGPECGRKCVQIIVSLLGGLRISVPDLNDIYRINRNVRIRNEFTGFNHEELALKYQLTVRQIRSILVVR